MEDLSVILEMENASLFEWEETDQAIENLMNEFIECKKTDQDRHLELILVQCGDDNDAENFKAKILEKCPDLTSYVSLLSFGIPNGRYYDLKNKGIEQASGDLVIFVDSDAPVEQGWLKEITSPFSDPKMMVVNGHTYIAHSTFMDRVYALYWFFPLRHNHDRMPSKRALNANNSAFRRSWSQKNPFQHNPGFKMSCGMLWSKIVTQRIPNKSVKAFAAHAPPQGIRFFFWRSFTAGRDQDRRFAITKTASKFKRCGHALSRFFTRTREALVRTFSHYQEVGFTVWQAPFAFIVWTVFSLMFMMGQLGHVFARSEKTEQLPDAIQIS